MKVKRRLSSTLQTNKGEKNKLAIDAMLFAGIHLENFGGGGGGGVAKGHKIWMGNE